MCAEGLLPGLTKDGDALIDSTGSEKSRRIDHQNVAKVYDSGEAMVSSSRHGIGRRTIPDSANRPDGLLPPARIAEIVRQAPRIELRARSRDDSPDLKPDKSWSPKLAWRRLVKVVDFGIAKVMDDQQQQVTQ